MTRLSGEKKPWPQPGSSKGDNGDSSSAQPLKPSPRSSPEASAPNRMKAALRERDSGDCAERPGGILERLLTRGPAAGEAAETAARKSASGSKIVAGGLTERFFFFFFSFFSFLFFYSFSFLCTQVREFTGRKRMGLIA